VSALLPTWDELAAARPALVAPMRRYLQQMACSLRPGSVSGVDLALRSFTEFLIQAAPELTTLADVTRRHIEDYKPWLAARPGRSCGRTGDRVTTNTIAHRLGTLRMFFVRIEDWAWPEAPQRVPIVPGDLPRQDKPLPKALDDPAAARFLRAAQAQPRQLTRVVCEVLLRTGLRVGEFTRLAADAVLLIGAGHCGSVNPIWPRCDGLIWPRLWCWSVGGALCPGVGEPVGEGAGFDDLSGEGETVDDGGAESGVGEGLGPAGERLVAGDGDRGFFLAFGEDLEWQLGAAAIELHVAQLV
jgi:hypothetical protein